ncbi:hypothetical protein, partial [Mycobacterium arosiense]|uniref:hypothetical protein n=1 Tax=Mycobacterium arosiense TaxID=425468 RepID=UPI001B801D27
SPLRCHLYPPMNDSPSPWTSSRGPVRIVIGLDVVWIAVTTVYLLRAEDRTYANAVSVRER